MSSAYQLKPWHQIAIPHKDIRDGKLDMSVYAASLGAVVRQEPKCPPVYRKAPDFFAATYMTAELKALLSDVLKVLNGGEGDRVLQLRTPFGGGKTHALISLYHITKHRQQLQAMADLAHLPDPGPVQTIAFIGLDLDASTGTQMPDGPRVLTPWGYLAWQLGGAETYALVEAQDRARIAPGNDVIRELLRDRTVLILLDEFLVYVENAMGMDIGDSTFGRQVLTFMQKLTEVVRDQAHTAMVYSLQASVQEAVGNEGLLSTLDKLVNRIDAKKEPVSGDEVMKVVQRRLFESVGDPDVIDAIARDQADLLFNFLKNQEDAEYTPQEAKQQADLLAERIKISYPFHPDLLDLMYHRWGSLPSYQRTRGALQFLARVIYALRAANSTSLLISPGDIPFTDEGVRGAFFSQVGEREQYSAVLAADLTGRTAKVKAVDQQIAEDSPALAHLQVGSRIAAAILMYSFGARGGEDRGVMEQDITAACLAPNLERSTLKTALNSLRDHLLYLHYVGKRYRFETKPNLNKLVADEESKVDSDDVLEYLKTSLGKLISGGRGRSILWPKDSVAIPDRTTEFTIVYLGAEWSDKSREAAVAEALQWVEYRGNDKREYKNALAFVIPSQSQLDKARKATRNALALDSLIDQKAKYKFTLEDIDELKEKSKDSKNAISSALRRLYDDVLLPVPGDPIRIEVMDLRSQLNTSQNLQERVLDLLKNHVFDSMTVGKLVRLANLSETDRQYVVGDDLVSYFFRFPNYPKMLSPGGIKQAIVQAIAQGQLGYVPYMTVPADGQPQVENPALVSFDKAIPLDELDLSGFLLAPALAQQLAYVAPGPETTNPIHHGTAGEGGSSQVNPELDPGDIADTGTPSSSESTDGREYVTQGQTSSITKTVLVEVAGGTKQAHSYQIRTNIDKAKLFSFFKVLQALSDRADTMTVEVTVRAQTTQGFEPGWISNAIEEPLDEMDIQASTRLE